MAISSFRDVIGLWPSRDALADDAYAHRGPRAKRRKRPNARVWYLRDRIPAWWIDAVVAAAQTRGFTDFTYADLARLHNDQDRRKGNTPPTPKE